MGQRDLGQREFLHRPEPMGQSDLRQSDLGQRDLGQREFLHRRVPMGQRENRGIPDQNYGAKRVFEFLDRREPMGQETFNITHASFPFQ